MENLVSYVTEEVKAPEATEIEESAEAVEETETATEEN
jgi:hypothetical protein